MSKRPKNRKQVLDILRTFSPQRELERQLSYRTYSLVHPHYAWLWITLSSGMDGWAFRYKKRTGQAANIQDFMELSAVDIRTHLVALEDALKRISREELSDEVRASVERNMAALVNLRVLDFYDFTDEALKQADAMLRQDVFKASVMAEVEAILS